ncbi:MAG: hypothetical protein K2K42_05025 [Eubacterium sp.]|nr:hypothetical protein [Eubacterium sp.]
MMKKMNKTRTWLMIAAIIAAVESVVFAVLGIRDHMNFNLEIVFSYSIGVVLFILGIIYPVIYKAELIIKKMEEEEDKKNK